MKKTIKFFLISLLVLVNMNVWAWYRTPEAARSFFWSFSADLLSRGVGNGGTIMPSGIAINPAGNAFAQRLKFEFGYGVAPGLWSEYSAGQYADPSDECLQSSRLFSEWCRLFYAELWQFWIPHFYEIRQLHRIFDLYELRQRSVGCE